MHTVVIQLQDQPQDWHLVEPFFYKGRSSGQLSFFKIEKPESYDQLYIDINRHLSQERISNWQVIVLMYVPTMSHGQMSMTKQYQLLSKKLIEPFEEQKFTPENVVFIVLDPLKRDSANAPEDDGSHTFWQLDNFGYYTDRSKITFRHNMFVKEELNQLDEVWGNGIDLKKAGLLQKPDPAYLEMIHEKKQRVLQVLDEIIDEKKQYAKEFAKENNHEVLSEEWLNDIYDLFVERLNNLLSPTLSLSLANYKPSEQLRTILKEKNSLLAVIEKLRIVRQDFLGYTVEKRTNALVAVALFINRLATETEMVNRIAKGTISELEGVLNNENFSEMLVSYYSCLQAAKVKIESKIFERQTVKKNKFEEVKAPPFSADPLKHGDTTDAEFKLQKRLTFLDEWQNEVDTVSAHLESGQKEIVDQAKAGWKSLDVSKRRTLTAEGEEVEIQDYLEELETKVENLYVELDELAPKENQEQSKWKNFIEKKGFHLNIFLKACPTNLQIGLGLLFAILFLLGPHLYTLNWQSTHFRENWLDYTLIPIIFIGTILMITFILKVKMEKPINKLLETVRNKRNHLFEEQKATHSKYNRYLNKLYELYRVRQQYLTVKQQYETEKQQNYYYRYHQSRIDEFIDSCEHFMSNLGLVKMADVKRFYEFFEAKFSPDKDVVDNPIYSPFECQTLKVQDAFDPKLNKDQVYPL